MTQSRGPEWWDKWFLGLAEYYASASKDPSTRVGAVIVNSDKKVVGMGFNGFPRGIADDERLHDRDTKYQIVQHAESNACLNAGQSISGCTVYTWPLPPCSRCASMLIQAGITRVVSPPPLERWKDNCALATGLFKEAGIICEEIQ